MYAVGFSSVQYVMIVCRGFIGIVFLVAVLNKISSRAAFRDFVQSVQDMVPSPKPIAPLVVAAELAIVLLLVTPSRTAGLAGFVLAGLLLVGFVGGIVRAMSVGNTRPCRCFGRSAKPLGRQHVIRNALLIAVAALGAVASVASVSVPLAPAALAAVSGLVLGSLVTMSEDLVALFR